MPSFHLVRPRSSRSIHVEQPQVWAGPAKVSPHPMVDWEKTELGNSPDESNHVPLTMGRRRVADMAIWTFALIWVPSPLRCREPACWARGKGVQSRSLLNICGQVATWRLGSPVGPPPGRLAENCRRRRAPQTRGRWRMWRGGGESELQIIHSPPSGGGSLWLGTLGEALSQS
jgi:hypothetical protein